MADLMRMNFFDTGKTINIGKLVLNFDFAKDQIEVVCARRNLEIGLSMVTLLRARGDDFCLGRLGA